jgi:hypothetical protein
MTKQNTETSPEAQPHSTTATHGNEKKEFYIFDLERSLGQEKICA